MHQICIHQIYTSHVYLIQVQYGIDIGHSGGELHCRGTDDAGDVLLPSGTASAVTTTPSQASLKDGFVRAQRIQGLRSNDGDEPQSDL